MGKLVKEKNWEKILNGLTICNIYITFAHEDIISRASSQDKNGLRPYASRTNENSEHKVRQEDKRHRFL